MPATERTGLPYFWATGIAKILVGDQPCQRETWVKGHYQLERTPQNAKLVQYQLDHTAMLTAEVDRLKQEGWKLRVEQFCRLTGKTAILGFKPDIIAQMDGKRPKVVDTKSGEPKDSDIAQVMIYCIAIPMAWNAPGMIFEGEVVYPTHRVPVRADEVGAMRQRLFSTLKDLGTGGMPEASPSEGACKYCEVPANLCDAKFVPQPDVLTSEW